MKEERMYKSRLQELCQQRKWRLPEYNTTKHGLDHNPRFSASVTINGVAFDTVAHFRSTKEAQNDAAKLAFDYLSDPKPKPKPSNPIPSPTSFPQPSLPASSALPPTVGTNLDSTRDTKIQETHQSPQVSIPFSGNVPGSSSQANGSTSGVEDGNRPKGVDAQHLYKNQLQTYAQKRNLLLPVYSCDREGPVHASRFKCRVTIDGQTYEGEEFFPTIKEAEHAAAKAACMSLLPNGVQEDDSGLYKNLLQELIQRERLCVPVYSTKISGEAHVPVFVSTVEIEGEPFTGLEARSKKQAEMSVAKIAYHTLRERKSSQIPLVLSHARRGQEASEILSSSFQSNVAADLQPGRPNAPMIVNSNTIITEQTKKNTGGGFFSSDVEYDVDYKSSPPASQNGSSSSLPSDSTYAVRDSACEPPAKRSMHNKVCVYPRKPNMKFPEGATVLPMSDEKWVAFSHN